MTAPSLEIKRLKERVKNLEAALLDAQNVIAPAANAYEKYKGAQFKAKVYVGTTLITVWTIEHFEMSFIAYREIDALLNEATAVSEES